MSTWQPAVFDPQGVAGRCVVHCRQRFLVQGDEAFFAVDALGAWPVAEWHGLGFLGGEQILLADLAEEIDLPGAEWLGLRQTHDVLADTQQQVLRYAAQIATWSAQHRFCGRCGTPLQAHPKDRARHCPACDLQSYPRLSPCMIVLVTRGDEVLLARSPRHAPGMYSTLAGFVEPGETVEACVLREVQEEVGVRVGNLRYIASQNWPFPHALMLGFHAEYQGGEIVLQPEEIEDARWFSLDALPPLPSRVSIARYLIELYRAERSGGPRPVLPA